MQTESTGKRRVPWVGIAVTIAIIFLVVAFGIFKRKGGRKAPPIPEEDTVSAIHTPAYA